ncbi:antirestriction protein ArdA [Hymenobacter sp. M29]|uniref:Antirestriction protein ArdA n=1 Tax=Hymenobacter mellowenesis TaxID=3063995 RepID=A0ABT9ACV8_9BACT|nr:antirestriction protein ArdA [Hymenobacter sp. M29]MDO7847666.1 antirestriction protein ArdA [Hymenobacter sp. M29]
MTDTPKIWVCSIRDYVNGHNVGEWLDLDNFTDEDEVLEAIQGMLKGWDEELGIDTWDVPREEWTIHDYEGFPSRFYSEYMSFGPVLQWIEDTQDMDEDRKEAYELYLDHANNPTLEGFEDSYRGYYKGGLEEYAEELTESCYDIPQHLTWYIDYAKIGRDMETNYEVWEENGHVFTR